jgi:hypothetical protein
MRVLVKRLLTDEFLTETGAWTIHASEARDFKYPADAQTFCRIHALEDSEPVLKSHGRVVGIYPSAYSATHADAPLNDF